MADIKAKKVIFKNRDGEHLIPYVGDSVIDHRITNCLLEIPQRIKYTLEDGILTIKAGSVVIYPFGTTNLTAQYPKGTTFLNNNLKVYDTQYKDGQFFVWAERVNDNEYGVGVGTMAERVLWSNEKGTSSSIGLAYLFSGTTAPTGDTVTWYDTANNMIKRKSNGGDWIPNQSFPLLMGDYTKDVGWNSIDQVFNGMGYIGSTIWVDKGVKGLACNGRNKDGTLNNQEFITSKIYTQTAPNATYSASFAIEPQSDAFQLRNITTWSYNKEENFFDWTGDSKKHSLCEVANVNINAGVISSFQPKQPFRAIDYSDKSEISGWSMPSSKYVDLTLGSSGSKYTAPANGWFYLNKTTQDGAYIALDNTTCHFRSFLTSSSPSSHNISAYIPAKKGDIIVTQYNATGATLVFRFIYAEGEV